MRSDDGRCMSLARKIQRRVARIEECRRQIALIERELADAERVLQITLGIADTQEDQPHVHR
jgi:hypothetical protein